MKSLKRLLCLLLCVLTAAMLSVFTAFAADTAYEKGDADGDGVYSVRDATLIQRYVIGITTLEGYSLEAADVDNDGSVSIYDCTLVMKRVVGLIDEFPDYSSEQETTQRETTLPVDSDGYYDVVVKP